MKLLTEIGKGIQVGIVNITPEQAAKMLERNVRNRKITNQRVALYTDEILKGNWMLNGDSVRFDFNGNLTDGQHRLHAIIKANVAVEMIVITGLNPEVFKNIDTGRNRSPGDVLSTIITDKTQGHAVKAGALIRRILVSEKSTSLAMYVKQAGNIQHGLTMTATNDAIVEYYREHKIEIDDVVEFGLKYQNKTKKIMNLTSLMFVLWYLRKINIDVAERFYHQLATGENLGTTDPIYHLREKLMGLSISEKRPPTWHYPAYIYKAWNSFRRGHEMKVLSIRSTEKEPVKPI